jgi:catechol 2,3-dioxygenase-like lactoylglutathione lyase family enzyme
MTDISFHHCAISVPNLDAAIEWYGAMLDYTVEKRFAVKPANAKAAMLRRGDLRIEVFEVPGAAPLPEDRRVPLSDLRTHGTKHPAYRVADMEAAISDFEAKGVEVVFVVREQFGKGCFIRDCAGNLIEFVEEDNV